MTADKGDKMAPAEVTVTVTSQSGRNGTVFPINPAMQSQCVQYVITGHILILITDHIKITSLGSFKMWTIFNL